MEYLCQDLNIPKKQIVETTTKNRFKSIAHKNFLKHLVKSKKLGNFQAYPHVIDEWPQKIGSNWEQVYIVVSGAEIISHSFVSIFIAIVGLQKVQPEGHSTAKV